MSVPFTPYSDGCSEEHGAGSIVQPLYYIKGVG